MHHTMPNWYLIYTRNKQEKKVSHQLEEKSVSFFLPTVRQLRQWHDRRKMIEAPLFPSYIFVRINSIEEFYRTQEMEGVISFVRFGKEIAVVKEQVVNNLRMIISSGNELEVTEERFSPGEQLIIQHGIFTGLSCEVVEHRNKRKVLVRIDILSRSVLTYLDTLEITGKPPVKQYAII